MYLLPVPRDVNTAAEPDPRYAPHIVNDELGRHTRFCHTLEPDGWARFMVRDGERSGEH
jgi:hypothetical protein